MSARHTTGEGRGRMENKGSVTYATPRPVGGSTRASFSRRGPGAIFCGEKKINKYKSDLFRCDHWLPSHQIGNLEACTCEKNKTRSARRCPWGKAMAHFAMNSRHMYMSAVSELHICASSASSTTRVSTNAALAIRVRSSVVRRSSQKRTVQFQRSMLRQYSAQTESLPDCAAAGAYSPPW